MAAAVIPHPTDTATRKVISKEELLRHCWSVKTKRRQWMHSKLARVLIVLDGTAITTSQAQTKFLYNRLLDMTRIPSFLKSTEANPGKMKQQSGHMNVEAMKGIFSSHMLQPHV